MIHLPKLSVVIPVYNAGKYLEECVMSVINQSYKDYEIILVDDGSSDGSEKQCDKFAEDYSCMVVLHQKNGGASSARNLGLREAKGEFVHFIDCDDYLSHSGVYEELSKKALDSSHDIIFFRRERFTEGKEGIDAVQPEYKIDGVFDGDALNHILTEQYGLTMTCPVNKIFRREFLIRNNLFFTEGLDHEEDEWLPRVIASAKRVWFDKGIYYTVRRHEGSLSQIMTEERKTDRACSKVIIASTGVDFMERMNLSGDTLSLAASYYWEYLTDACIACNQIKSKQNRERIYKTLRENKSFFNSSRLLKSRNRRLLGLMFRTIGIKPTVKIIGYRYGK